jgi:tetratricopeptide (TPR) repeat protein
MELVGRLDVAIAWTIRARDLEPDNSDHTEYLADLYVDLNDFRTARQLDAIDAEENSGLMLKMRQYEEFIDVAEFEYLEDPDNVELLYWLAYAYNIVGRSEDAVRMLSAAGLPDAIKGEVKNARDLEAQVTLIDALDQLGQQELAQPLANRWSNSSHSVSDYYWVPLYLSCSLAVEGRDEEALSEIARISRSPRLPWETLIRDMPCFRRYAEEPAYLEMLQDFADRRKSIRARLPATLAEYGVSL